MVSASFKCHDPSTVNAVTAKATQPEKAKAAFEAFCGLIGVESHGSASETTFVDGHRQINWDAGLVPFDMPGPFFSDPITRGCICSTSDGEFVVSNPPDGSDDKFDSIDPDLSSDLQTFSESRLFTSLNDNVIDVTFVVPSNICKPAAVTGFGAIFVDVDLEGKTKMEFFDANGCKLATEYVPAEPSGLSFAGVEFGQESIVALVRITLGTSSLSGYGYDNIKRGKGKNKKTGGGTPRDVVVLDDFIYGEPQAIY